MRRLHERYRAVTPDDHEYLIREAWPRTDAAGALGDVAKVGRVRCVVGRDLTAADPTVLAPAHVSVVVVPESTPESSHPQPAKELTTALRRFLEPRRVLTTRHHVVGPSYVDVGIAADLALYEDAPALDALTEAQNRLTTFFHPLDGGVAGDGWPFGHNVYVSEVYAVLEQGALIDYVEQVRLTGPKPIPDPRGNVAGIGLDEHQLVRLARLDLAAYDGNGSIHPLSWTST
jgi:phage-related baseplate assembly protein